ncbi:hypothetical protein PLICRDRAFT_119855, partial [Plicaturopsis crispa FD-325 SS-3]
SQNDYLREWLPRKNEYLERLLLNECPPKDQHCPCGAEIRYKCLDCMGRKFTCSPCCRSAHRHMPFHRIERWNDLYYEPAWLTEVCILSVELSRASASALPDDYDDASEDEGLSDGDVENWEDDDEFTLKHLPERPPREENAEADVEMVIVDRSGVHRIGVRWCRCHHAPTKDLQLVDSGLFPASFENIKTAFTFHVLDDFLMDNLECKTSCMNFYNKLRRVTNSTFPFTVPDRYRELTRLSRQWRHLLEMLSQGYGHTNDKPADGDLAIFCPACPQPGINLPDNWKEDPDQYKYRRTVVMDGNFKCVLEKPKRPDDDVHLTDGELFFPRRGPYQEHIKIAIDIKGVILCNEHQAAMSVDFVLRNLLITGFGGGACARHGACVPNTLCDFQKGERQRNMDYCLSKALSYNSEGLPSALVLYDIMCQYGVHLKKRFDHSPYIDLPAGMDIYTGIGLFHVHGHKQDCFAKFAPSFIHGAGMVAGEIMETDWPRMNAIAPSTRCMTEAHRREVLDHHMNDMNFMKMLRMPGALVKKLKAAHVGRLESAQALQDLCEGNTDEQLKEWTALEESIRQGRLENNDLMEAYDLDIEQAPTLAKIQNDLIEREQRKREQQGTASWIAKGLAIEEEQIKLATAVRKLPRSPTQKQALSINKRREKLQKKITSWASESKAFYQGNDIEEMMSTMGFGAEYDTDTEERDDEDMMDKRISPEEWAEASRPEDIVLMLPSSFTREALVDMDLTDLAKCEIKLRQGQANDALHALRMTLGHKSVLFRTKVRHDADSQRKKGRAWAKVFAAETTIRHHARVYGRCREALQRLEARDSVLKRYQELKRHHLKVTTEIADPNPRGSRNDSLTWLWNIGGADDMENSDFMKRLYEVHWLKAKARADRWNEEFNIIWSEMDWTVRYFRHQGDIWVERTRVAQEEGKQGSAAYGARQAAMWAKFCSQARMVFHDAKSTYQL